jgi:hypothetical protein
MRRLPTERSPREQAKIPNLILSSTKRRTRAVCCFGKVSMLFGKKTGQYPTSMII